MDKQEILNAIGRYIEALRTGYETVHQWSLSDDYTGGLTALKNLRSVIEGCITMEHFQDYLADVSGFTTPCCVASKCTGNDRLDELCQCGKCPTKKTSVFPDTTVLIENAPSTLVMEHLEHKEKYASRFVECNSNKCNLTKCPAYERTKNRYRKEEK